MNLSIVTTLYRSQPFLRTFHQQMSNAIQKLGINDYEVVYVNDGSPDDSVSCLLEMRRDDSHIRIIDLSRNFGHHYALQAGISFASGDYVYIVDNDMETPVDFLLTCYSEMLQHSNIDLIYGVQEQRKGHLVEKMGGFLFWKIFNMLSDVRVPANILTECLMTRNFVDELLRLNDANLFLGGMIHWVGMEKKEIVVKKGQREGKSTYTFRKRLSLMIQALTSFSGKPLEWLFYSGIGITCISVVFLLYLFVKKMILGNAISLGWTSLIGINLLTLGIITTFLGLIGLYVFRIYKQVQGRPNYVIKKVY